MRKKGEKWIIDATFESSFYHFSFLEKKKQNVHFCFLSVSFNHKTGGWEREKDAKRWNEYQSRHTYIPSQKEVDVCAAQRVSLSRISWMQSVSILHVPTDWSSRRRKIFLHPRSHHHIYSASISHNICVCAVCVCFRSFLAQFFRLNQFLLSIRNVWQSAHSRLPIIPRQLFTILIRRASKKKKNEINTHICSYYFQNKLLQ